MHEYGDYHLQATKLLFSPLFYHYTMYMYITFVKFLFDSCYFCMLLLCCFYDWHKQFLLPEGKMLHQHKKKVGGGGGGGMGLQHIFFRCKKWCLFFLDIYIMGKGYHPPTLSTSVVSSQKKRKWEHFRRGGGGGGGGGGTKFYFQTHKKQYI